MTTAYIAIDLGAESGRVIVGVLENERLRLEEKKLNEERSTLQRQLDERVRKLAMEHRLN